MPIKLKRPVVPNVVVYDCNSHTWEAEAGGSL